MQQNDLIRTVQLRKLLAVVEELERLGVYVLGATTSIALVPEVQIAGSELPAAVSALATEILVVGDYTEHYYTTDTGIRVCWLIPIED